MKKIIPFLIILASCAKQSANRPSDVSVPYAGIYNSISGDTAFVSKGEGIYTIIRLSKTVSRASVTFDSVIVFQDMTLSDNETVALFDRHNISIGTGKFVNNHLTFSFDLSPSRYKYQFDGIK